jgi:hypothetical protein
MIVLPRLLHLLRCALAPLSVGAQSSAALDTTKPAAVADTVPKTTVGPFLDGYYAWDCDRPYNLNRAVS